jgi:hypothetical protein
MLLYQDVLMCVKASRKSLVSKELRRGGLPAQP